MQVTAIIAEWNPLHRGHLLPVQAARQQGGHPYRGRPQRQFCPTRGEPALCPWQYRAAAALSSGVDLVLQLPLPYAISTAQHFAGGAPASLAALGAVDSLIFGSECGELAALPVGRRRPGFSRAPGRPWPPICKKACPLRQPGRPPFIPSRGRCRPALLPPITSSVSVSPALRRLGSDIQPLTISRQGAPHDAAEPDTDFSSASQLRQRFLTGQGYLLLPAPRPWPNSWSWPGSGGPPPTGALGAGIFLHACAR